MNALKEQIAAIQVSEQNRLTNFKFFQNVQNQQSKQLADMDGRMSRNFTAMYTSICKKIDEAQGHGTITDTVSMPQP